MTAGFTMIELLVTLLILSLLTGIVGVQLGRTTMPDTIPSWRDSLPHLLHQAHRIGRPQNFIAKESTEVFLVTVYPNGVVLIGGRLPRIEPTWITDDPE